MSMEIEIPRDVDSQMQVLWWETDELFTAMLIFGTGLTMHKFILPVICAFIAMRQISKAKSAALPGAGLHWLYSLGLSKVNKEYDNAMEKDFYL